MTEDRNRINIGIPVEWMVDPDNPERALGVVYEFSQTGERRKVWYTPDGKPTRTIKVVTQIKHGNGEGH